MLWKCPNAAHATSILILIFLLRNIYLWPRPFLHLLVHKCTSLPFIHLFSSPIPLFLLLVKSEATLTVQGATTLE